MSRTILSKHCPLRCSERCNGQLQVTKLSCTPFLHMGHVVRRQSYQSQYRKTSTQQAFDSDMLLDVAACMYQLLLHLSHICASAHCIVACLYLHSEKCNHHLIRLEHFGLHVTQCDVSSHESAQHGCVYSQASSD